MGQERDAQRGQVSHADERRRVQDVYDGYAADSRKQRAWSGTNAGNQAMRAELVAAVLPLVPPEGLILDVGCGGGWWLAALAGTGIAPERLAGVEIQPARADAAGRRVPGADVRVGDATALPYDDNSVAFVTLLTVVSSVGGDGLRRRALREACRVTAPTGLVVLWEPRLPTGNRQTARVARALLRHELGDHLQIQSLTVLPPLARRVEGSTYRRLARIPLLRSHRLVVARM